MIRTIIRTIPRLLLLIAAAAWAGAETGGVTCTVRDALTSANLGQSAGSNVDDYNEFSLDLQRVGTSCVFSDGAVDVTSPGGGYTITGYATDYVPQTATNVQVSAGTTTVVGFRLYRPVLSLSISPSSFSENGGTATATVTLRDGSGNAVALRNNLTITASSGNTSKATVTQPATIAAGSSSTTFTITGVDNAIHDGDTVVTISVSTAWGSGNANVTVTDDDP